MKGNEIGLDVPGEPEDLFEMANLYPSTTGLPMTVWVSPRGNAHHELRVRVNMTHGDQIDIADTAVVVVRPTPCVIAGQLSPAGAQAVFRWISLNTDALVAYWEGQIDTAGLCQMLKPLPAQQNHALTSGCLGYRLAPSNRGPVFAKTIPFLGESARNDCLMIGEEHDR
jgi:hypothetical protein